MATNGPSSIDVSFYSWIKTSRTNSNGQKDLIDCKRCRTQQTANYFFRAVRIPKWISFTVRLIVAFPPCWLRKLTWCQAFNWYLVACIVICKMFRDMFACLTWYVQTGNLVTTSFHGKTQKLLSQFKEGPIPLNGVLMDVPDLRSIKKTAEKELSYHTLKDLLCNQIFYKKLQIHLMQLAEIQRKSSSQSQPQGNLFEFC